MTGPFGIDGHEPKPPKVERIDPPPPQVVEVRVVQQVRASDCDPGGYDRWGGW